MAAQVRTACTYMTCIWKLTENLRKLRKPIHSELLYVDQKLLRSLEDICKSHFQRSVSLTQNARTKKFSDTARDVLYAF